MTLTQEEIEAQTIWQLPMCEYCKKIPEPKTCMVFWSGKICCGLCVAKLYEWQQAESERIMREVINNGKTQ